MAAARDDTLDVGFTGTRQGMTPAQESGVRNFLTKVLQRRVAIRAHHGDCVGADAGFHEVARSFDACEIHVHPPNKSFLRAWCNGDVMHDARPYLDRNMDIIEACPVILAAPRSKQEEQRSGTWSTIRRSQRLGRRVLIFYPDGSLETA